MEQNNVLVIGGGTGSYVLLSGLRNYPINLKAIVSVTDSGGSTGRLRTEFGFLPVGDMRQCLAALTEKGKDDILRKLLLYRFEKGKGLKGHNLGNLILTVLTELTGSEAKAVETAAKIFRLKGEVFPISLDNVHLVAKYEDGLEVKGEHEIDEPKHVGGKRIVSLTTTPKAIIYKEAADAIMFADLIVLGPGDLYTSILPNLIVTGAKKVFAKTKAKIVYVVNLMTRFSQTHKMTANNHIQEIERYLGRSIDIVIINNAKIPNNILTLYEKEKGFPVIDDLGKSTKYQVIRESLLASKVVFKPVSDVLQRSFLRHNSDKLAKTINSLLVKQW